MNKHLHRATCGCLMCAMTAAAIRLEPHHHVETAETVWHALNPILVQSTATLTASARVIGLGIIQHGRP